MSDSSGNGNKVIPDDVVEVLLEATAPVAPGQESEARIHKRLMARVKAKVTKDDEDIVTVFGADGDWFEPVPGNKVKMLRADPDSQSILVRLEPGTVFPAHFHPADEETYVIAGEAWFGDTRLVAGDYHLARKGTHHGEVRTDTGCTFFIRKANEAG